MRYNSGRGDDIETIEVNAGDLKFTVLKSRCLDIGQAFYKGIPLAHLSKSGLTAPKFFWKTKEREISIISMVASW
jgi:hypothetical protein